MSRILLVVLSFLVFELKAQEIEKFFYKADGEILPSQEKAFRYLELKKTKNGYETAQYRRGTYFDTDPEWVKMCISKVKYKNDSTLIINEYVKGIRTKYTRIYEKKADSLYYVKEYKGKLLEREGMTKSVYPLIKTGAFVSYHDNEKPRMKEIYFNNKMIKNRRWDKEGNELCPNVYAMADKLPTYKGEGFKSFYTYLSKNLHHLAGYQDARVVCRFVAMEDGSIREIDIVEKDDRIFNAEVLRVVKASAKDWRPGEIEGKPVRVQILLPINFYQFSR